MGVTAKKSADDEMRARVSSILDCDNMYNEKNKGYAMRYSVQLFGTQSGRVQRMSAAAARGGQRGIQSLIFSCKMQYWIELDGRVQ